MQETTSLVQAFKAAYTTSPRLFFSPGRINLIGEHIDYNDGFVLPAAINKGIWFAIALNDTNEARFISIDEQAHFTIPLDNLQKLDGWKNYVLGVLHILQQDGFALQGFDCAFGGNVPQGAGLSSSAALEAGLAYALNKLCNYNISKQELALIAQRAEHSYPGTKCGIMDMFASLHGKKNHCILLDCVSLEYDYSPLLFDDYEWVLINSKVKHSLNDGAYNKRREEAGEGFAFFKSLDATLTSYRQLSADTVKQYRSTLATNIYQRSLYITQEIARTQQAATLLKQNDLKGFGKLMNETHHGLSSLYLVSCAELDFLATKAQSNEAVIGSRMMGGGFGGCTINLIAKKNRAQVVDEIVAAYEAAFNIKPEVYLVETSDGTHELALNA